MTTLRWTLTLKETSKPGLYDLCIVYDATDENTPEFMFRRRHLQRLKDKIPAKGTLTTDTQKNGSVVIRGAMVTELVEVRGPAGDSTEPPEVVSYELHFGSSANAASLASVLKLGSSPGLWEIMQSRCFVMPRQIQEDSPEWKAYKKIQRRAKTYSGRKMPLHQLNEKKSLLVVTKTVVVSKLTHSFFAPLTAAYVTKSTTTLRRDGLLACVPR
ncbi:hypothetical protein QBC45DRAFT_386873 [Copromyces sp. CBS 386.78]|nr:hypothetical protein QBC45DRAFT_386873 [Copromyces sp. CBS 386.78]